MLRKSFGITLFGCLLAWCLAAVGCGNDGTIEVRPAPAATVIPTATAVPEAAE